MTEQEFLSVMAYVETYWHADDALPEEAVMAYAAQLRGEQYVDVLAAVEALGLEGKTRTPLAGEIKRKLVLMRLDPPQWAEVSRMLVRVAQKSGDYVYWPEGKSGWNDRVVCNDRKDYVATLHPMVQSFIALIGLDSVGEMRSSDRVAEAQLRQKWEAHVSQTVETHVLAGVGAASTLPRLQRAKAEVGQGQVAPGIEMPVLKEIGP